MSGHDLRNDPVVGEEPQLGEIVDDIAGDLSTLITRSSIWPRPRSSRRRQAGRGVGMLGGRAWPPS